MRKIVLLALLFISVGKMFAQVNMQSGSATFSLPMFNWQDGKSRLNSVVSINYSSGSGLKTDDVASNIGQGWNLVAGGVITRMQVGEPDDQKPFVDGSNDLRKYPAGYLYNPVTADNGCPLALMNYPIYKDRNHLYKERNEVAADRELDYFSFQFNGRTGVFVLKKSDSTGVLLGDARIKISFNTGDMTGSQTRTRIKSFTIQDENGLIYRFQNFYSKAKVLKNSYCDPNLIQDLTQPEFNSGTIYHQYAFDDATIPNPYVINSWYLAEIEDPLIFPTRKVTFNYTSRNIDAQAGSDIAYYADKNYAILSRKRSLLITQDITSITYPDGHSVTLNYGANRVDLNGSKVLSSVDIVYNFQYISKYQLNTSYMMLNRYGIPETDFQKQVARLCLRSVVQYGPLLNGYNEPYYFDYYLGSGLSNDDIVPPPFSYAKDVWGYYNGAESSGTDGVSIGNNITALTKPLWEHTMGEIRGLVFLRTTTAAAVTLNPKTGYARNGLLKQVRYPAGGSLTYEYEQNSGVLDVSTTTIGGVHVARTKLVDGGYTNDCDHPLVTNYNYVLNGSVSSSLWGLEMPRNSLQIGNHYAPASKYYKFLAGCVYRYKYPGIQSKEQAVDLNGGQLFAIAFSEVMNWVSVVTTVIDAISYAARLSGPGSVIIDGIGAVLNFALTCFSSNNIDTVNGIYYNFDFNAVNPLPSQYSRVEVVEGDGGNGKTVFEFTSDADYAIWEPANPTGSMKQRFANWAYGLPKITTWYDKDGYKVKQTENKYEFNYAKQSFPKTGDYAFPSCKCEVKENYSQMSSSWENPASYDPATTFIKTSAAGFPVQVAIYDVFSGRIQLKETDERIYKQGTSSYAEVVTNYEYHTYGATNDNLLPYKILTRQSNGVRNMKLVTYSVDYNTTGDALAALRANNIVAEPVSSSNYVYADTGMIMTYQRIPGEVENRILSAQSLSDVDGEYPAIEKQDNEENEKDDATDAIVNSPDDGYWKILNETVTEFTTVANGNIKPYRTLVQRFSQPTYPYTLYVAPGSASNPAGYKETQTFAYDSRSNLVEMKDEGGHIVTNIYGYDDKYIIASVINASAADVPAYTSFETNDQGRWQVNGTPYFGGTVVVTGTGAFTLAGSNSLSANINTAKAYTLSCWATSGVSVSGSAVLAKSGPTINGFTYYEFNVPQGVATVIVTGNCLIDELRLYPSNARMRTIAYSPVIGKTSETDENNRTTYYEYEQLGRLRFIKDDKGNIVKMYEYNTAKKPGGCISDFTNLPVKEIFTRNNCGSGYQAESYEYTIAAGTFHSSISQEDVDRQVQQYINDHAQIEANANGSCSVLYYNTAHSESFTPETCPDGSTAPDVTYTVAANKYSSTNPALPDQLALAEIKSNGQAYANSYALAHGTCVTNTDPIWITDDDPVINCEVVGGVNTGYQIAYFHNINPNVTVPAEWKRVGQNTTSCPIPSGTGNISYYNYNNTNDFDLTIVNTATNASQSYTIPAGDTGPTILGTLADGDYTVTIAPHTYQTTVFDYRFNNDFRSSSLIVTINMHIVNGEGLLIEILN
ncbi:MAG: DUF5977 domain-containing protein [Bacteroidota bacterium]